MILFGRDLSNDLLVVAEIGQNHEGSVDKAKELISAAIDSGADAAKLQSFTPSRLCSREEPERLARLEKFALNEADQIEIFSWARGQGFPIFSTPATEDWVEFVHVQSRGVVKIASGDSTFLPTILRAANRGSTLLLSTGGTTVEELDGVVEKIASVVGPVNLNDRLALLHCVSCYPPEVGEANFGAIPFLRKRYSVQVGFSNHFVEREVPLAAVACGASILEIHVTDDRRGRDFRDHALSFEPDELHDLVTLARQMRRASVESRKELQSCELTLVSSLRKGLVAARDLAAGTVLDLADLSYARSSSALPWHQRDDVVGRVLRVPVLKGFPVIPEAVEGSHSDGP